MGYESTLIIGAPSPHATDDDGRQWLRIVAVLEVGKCYDEQFTTLLRDAPEADVYWYATLASGMSVNPDAPMGERLWIGDCEVTRDPYGKPLKQLDFTATHAALLSGDDPSPLQYAAAAALAAFVKVPHVNLYHYGH
jgi:hypothetical protein